MSKHILLLTLIAVMVVISTFTPFIQEMLGDTEITNDPDAILDPEEDSLNALTLASYPIQVVKIAFYGFGVLPFWFNMILWVIRISIIMICIDIFLP